MKMAFPRSACRSFYPARLRQTVFMAVLLVATGCSSSFLGTSPLLARALQLQASSSSAWSGVPLLHQIGPGAAPSTGRAGRSATPGLSAAVLRPPPLPSSSAAGAVTG
ncbi:unnamed protein product, partial [Amoebophrya sp. A120]|eukprot:GSA120T00023128001.1